MTRTAVVTGAGSGVGRSTTLKLLSEGWNVALVGRRESALQETAALAGTTTGRALVSATDIGDPQAVHRMAQAVVASLGDVEVLVNAAGTNVPHRALEVLSQPD